MIDLRARLADVLGDAFINVPAGVNDDFSWANYLADVLLSLPGIAIVELPELVLLICSGCMRNMSYCVKSPCDERAALLSAAERSTT